MSKLDTVTYYESQNKYYGVRISNRNMQRLYDLCTASYPYETGGVLIGKYSDDLKSAEISTITGPPEGSKQTRHTFIRSAKNTISLLKESWKIKQYYLGEWHYHPGASPHPSGLDRTTMIKLSENEALHCPEPVLLIIGGKPSDWHHYIGVYVNGEEIELHNVNY